MSETPISQAVQGTNTKTTKELWDDAIKEVQERGIDVQSLSLNFHDLHFDEKDDGVDKAVALFRNKRHPKDKTDKTVQAIGGVLDFLDSIAGFIKENVSGTSATPVQLFTGAISQMIKAAKNVSEYLDLIDETFGSIHNALKDIGQFNNFSWEEDKFTASVVAIFVALFSFCWFSKDLFKRYSRRHLFLRSFIKGKNEKIKARCLDVTSTIKQFRESVAIKSLVRVEGVYIKMDEVLDAILEGKRFKSSDFQVYWDKLSERIKEIFKKYKFNFEGMSLVEKQTNKVKAHIVPGTFSWILDCTVYNEWKVAKGRKTPFLYIQGATGSGKSFFLYHCYQKLQERAASSRTSNMAQDPSESRIPQEVTCVAQFSFEPGETTSHLSMNVLASIIVQIAEQDDRFAGLILKRLDKEPRKLEQTPNKVVEYLWDEMIVKNFARNLEPRRNLYILLDGVENISSKNEEAQKMFEFLLTLNCAATCIQIMMTHTPQINESQETDTRSRTTRTKSPSTDTQLSNGISPAQTEFVHRNPYYIDLDGSGVQQKESLKKDLKLIIEYRIQNSKNLKSFKEKFIADIKNDLVNINWPEGTGARSMVDLVLSLIEQNGDDETVAKERLNQLKAPKIKVDLLYRMMVETVLAGRSSDELKSIKKLFSWCTYAMQPLNVDQLQQIWKFDGSSEEFDVGAEVRGKSSSLLYIAEEKSISITHQTPYSGTVGTAGKEGYQYISFRQPAFKEYLRKQENGMIEDPLQLRVEILVTLCEALCRRDVDFDGGESRKMLQWYAAIYLTRHLSEIEVQDANSIQSQKVVEALAQVLYNKNNVSMIFESLIAMERLESADNFVETYLYGDFESHGHGSEIASLWAMKIEDIQEQLNNTAKRLVKVLTTKSPKESRLLKRLAFGHLRSLAQKVTAESAEVPYKLTYRSLRTAGLFQALPHPPKISLKSSRTVSITSSEPDVETTPSPFIADKLLNFAEKNRFHSSELARLRIALALLLQRTDNEEYRQKAMAYYEENMNQSDGSNPEKFYSALGLAECQYPAILDWKDISQIEDTKWAKMEDFSVKALTYGTKQAQSPGSIESERYCAAFLLKALALYKSGKMDEAVRTCESALRLGELEYCKGMNNILTFVLGLYAEKDKYWELIAQVCQQHPRFKYEWLWHRSDKYTDKSDSLRKAAVLTKRVDILITLFKEAIDYWEKIDYRYAGDLEYELLVIYRRDARAVDMAERTLETMMKKILSDPEKMKGGTLRVIFPERVDLHHQIYMESKPGDPNKKDSISKLEALIRKLRPTDIIEQIDLAQALITLAKMYRNYGGEKLALAKDQASQAFDICIADLEDSIQGNDVPALRVLAQILMYAGLEYDAKISISLVLSKIDQYETSYASDDSIVFSDDTSMDAPASALPSTNHTDTSDDDPSESFAESLEISDYNYYKSKSLGTHSLNSESGKDNISEQDDSPELENRTNFDRGMDNDVNMGDHTWESQPSNLGRADGQEYLDWERERETEDEGEGEGKDDFGQIGPMELDCNACNKPPISQWPTNPDDAGFHYCLDCHNVFLCDSCYKQQLRYQDGLDEGFWFQVCWARHDFLEAPIEGWGGVKENMLAIGPDRIWWKGWIQSVKNKWSKEMSKTD